MNTKLIALDMDRTTLDENGHLSAVNRCALESAIAQGIHVVVASGRAFHTLPEEVLAIDGLEYAISSNGSAVYSVKDQKCLKRFRLLPHSVEEVFRLTEGMNVTYEAFIDGNSYAEAWYVENPIMFEGTKYAKEYIRKTRKPVYDIKAFTRENIDKLEALAIVIMGEFDKAAITSMLMDNDPDIYVTMSVSRLLEISHKDSGKVNGVKFLANHLGIKREEIAAFGDADNDVEMLEYAGMGIAVANAMPSCMAAADAVTLRHNENGVAHGMEVFLGIDTSKAPVIEQMRRAEETGWINPRRLPDDELYKIEEEFGAYDIAEAESRLQRFAPLIARCFPETALAGGIIESPLDEIPGMRRWINNNGSHNGENAPEALSGTTIPGRLFLKRDDSLAVAGSVKARGGIYEVLCYAEKLALEAGFIKPGDNYVKLAEQDVREFFSRYKIQVGSTGNLGLSIGIASAALGFKVTVHMSSDARQWKKDMLRSKGVEVIEYKDDYSQAVLQGRRSSEADPMSYFIDDENSGELFLGYSTAASRLKNQLDEKGITVDGRHPLFVYIPCGVGGAPGGITFGLRKLFGDNVYCFFAEPVQSPCMLAGMATGKGNQISVRDLGLTGATQADGLACQSPSGLSVRMMEPHLTGIFTVEDYRLFEYMRALEAEDGIFIEPSSCAAFRCCDAMKLYEKTAECLKNILNNGVNEEKITHIVWATGGKFVPEDEREKYRHQ